MKESFTSSLQVLSQRCDSGTIPGTLGQLKGLIMLDLSNNQFSGTLDELAKKTVSTEETSRNAIRFFSAAANDLSGVLLAHTCSHY